MYVFFRSSHLTYTAETSRQKTTLESVDILFRFLYLFYVVLYSPRRQQMLLCIVCASNYHVSDIRPLGSMLERSEIASSIDFPPLRLRLHRIRRSFVVILMIYWSFLPPVTRSAMRKALAVCLMLDQIKADGMTNQKKFIMK